MISDMHHALDDRIYWKESISLQKNGYSVTHICTGNADLRYTTAEGIEIIQIAKPQYFKNPVLNKLYKKAFRKDEWHQILKYAIEKQYAYYHIHDLKPNKIGRRLKRSSWKPKVIYDIHDPFAQNLIDYNGSRNWFIKFLIKCYSRHILRWQYRCASNYDLVITTEENLQLQFQENTNTPVEIIYNYTTLFEERLELHEKEYDLIYCGGITKFRGAMEMLQAINIVKMEKADISAIFVGPITPSSLKDEIDRYIHDNNLTENVVLAGSVAFDQVPSFYQKSRIGLGIFLPIPTHHIILQIKTFEYMAFGLPIIASNFGHIADYVAQHNAGILVDPRSPETIAEAIVRLLQNENLYQLMSKNGRDAVAMNYQWNIMEAKLLKLYSSL